MIGDMVYYSEFEKMITEQELKEIEKECKKYGYSRQKTQEVLEQHKRSRIR